MDEFLRSLRKKREEQVASQCGRSIHTKGHFTGLVPSTYTNKRNRRMRSATHKTKWKRPVAKLQQHPQPRVHGPRLRPHLLDGCKTLVATNMTSLPTTLRPQPKSSCRKQLAASRDLFQDPSDLRTRRFQRSARWTGGLRDNCTIFDGYYDNDASVGSANGRQARQFSRTVVLE